MKNSKLVCLLCALICTLTFACKSNKQDLETIQQYVGPLNAEYSSICGQTDLLSSVAVAMEGNNLTVTVDFASDEIAVPDLSEALVQYGLAFWLKQHTGARLDNILNSLGHIEGSLELTLNDVNGDSRTYTITPSRLKQLVRLRPMELNFNEVKTNISEIMSRRCGALRDGANGCTGATFQISGGFAQYTLSFGRAADYRDFTQASLTGKYVNLLKPQYTGYGELKPYILSVLESLQIEGYRFIYQADNNTTPLRAAIPWRLLN